MASAATKPLELPPRLRGLYDFMHEQDGEDVDIFDIYCSVISENTPALREAQQQLGPYITRLNRRLREHRRAVKPGRLKGTYALVSF